MSKWTKVKKRLPEKGEEVIVKRMGLTRFILSNDNCAWVWRPNEDDPCCYPILLSDEWRPAEQQNNNAVLVKEALQDLADGKTIPWENISESSKKENCNKRFISVNDELPTLGVLVKVRGKGEFSLVGEGGEYVWARSWNGNDMAVCPFSTEDKWRKLPMPWPLKETWYSAAICLPREGVEVEVRGRGRFVLEITQLKNLYWSVNKNITYSSYRVQDTDEWRPISPKV